jgi:ATP-dependent helicase/nuclease subunit A
MHRMLQVLPDAPVTARPRLAAQMATRAGHPERLAQEALTLLEEPGLAWLFQPGALSEVVLAGRIESLGLDVSGRIDRLIVSGQNIIIADYKTDRVWPESADAAPSAYVRQMALYRQLMLDAYPGCTVRCLLVWTSAPLTMDLGEELLNAALRDLQGARP